MHKENPGQLTSKTYKGITTLLEGFKQTAERIPNHKFLGTRNPKTPEREYMWRTFTEVDTLMENFARGKNIML